MYPSRRRQTYVKRWSAVLPLALNTPICPRHPGVTEHCSAWEVIKRPITSRLHRNLTSPGYSAGSAFRLLKYHYPSRLSSPSVSGNLTSLKVSFDRSLLEGDHCAPFELGLLAHHVINAGNVLDEWVFSCQFIGDLSPHPLLHTFLSFGNQKIKNIF